MAAYHTGSARASVHDAVKKPVQVVWPGVLVMTWWLVVGGGWQSGGHAINGVI